MTASVPLTPQDAASLLDRYLRTETFPLGIRVFRVGEPLPDRTRRPLQGLHIKVSICQGISMARRYGWTVGMGAADVNCPIAEVAFGFKPALPYYEEGNLAAGMYVVTCGQGRETEATIPRFGPEETGIVVVAPLARCAFTPQTVLVYGNSGQVLIAVAASLWSTGGALTATTSARADCADIVIRTAQTGKPQLILPCGGDRIFGHTQDHEMAFTVPWAEFPRLVEGLEGTYKGGIRYPIPQFLRYTPEFPPAYQKLEQLWSEGEGE